MQQTREIAAFLRLVSKRDVTVIGKKLDGTIPKGKGSVEAEPMYSNYGFKMIIKADLDGTGTYERHYL